MPIDTDVNQKILLSNFDGSARAQCHPQHNMTPIIIDLKVSQFGIEQSKQKLCNKLISLQISIIWN